MEAHRKSGTMITVGFALEQGKDVLAVPGRIDDPQGCNELIAQGAKIVLKGEDIIEELY
jgi:DNA processing protein